MSKQLRALCFVSVAMAIPGLAAAQSPNAFGGTYAGVTNTGDGFCSPLVPVPRPLTITNGVVQFQGGFQSRPTLNFQGSVSPQGALTMKDQESHIANGSIDATGKLTASIHAKDSARDRDCILTAVWQKQ